jgi:hypothetical protein
MAVAGGDAGAAARLRLVFSLVVGLLAPLLVAGDDPYRFFTWTVTYGDIYPLGVKQQVRRRSILASYILLLAAVFPVVVVVDC